MTIHKTLAYGIISALVLFQADYSYAQQVTVDGTASNIDSKQLYLYSFEKLSWQTLDSVEIIRNRFKFSSKIPKRGWYRIGSTIDRAVEIILGEDKVVLSADFSSSPPVAEYKRSPENEGLLEYQRFLTTARVKLVVIDSMSKAMRKLHGQELENARDSLASRMKQLESFKNQHYVDFSASHPELFIGKLAGFYAVHPGMTVDDYFTEEDFIDRELASPLYYQGKLISYLQLQRVKDLKTLTELVDKLIDRSPQASVGREALFITAIDFLKSSALDYASSLVRRYQMEFPNSESAIRLAHSLPKPGPQIGEMAPEITLSDQTGDRLLLSSLRGKYVLLDFWASWCGPCRKEAPVVVAAYNQFKDLGFTIYSVSLDSNKDRWLGAIEKDGLDWYHVSDLAGWKSEAAALYQVRSIPATYLIDPEGKIIAKDLRGPVLTRVLRETLEKSYQEDQ